MWEAALNVQLRIKDAPKDSHEHCQCRASAVCWMDAGELAWPHVTMQASEQSDIKQHRTGSSDLCVKGDWTVAEGKSYLGIIFLLFPIEGILFSGNQGTVQIGYNVTYNNLDKFNWSLWKHV